MTIRVLTVVIALVLAAGCGGGQSDADEATENVQEGAQAIREAAEQMAESGQQNAEQMAQGLQQMAEGFQQMAQGSAEAVEFEALVDLLPEVDGWTRSDERGEQLSMPVSYSRAEAIYRQDDSRIELEITDTALSRMLLAPMSMFLASGFSERSSEGFKRAAEIGGHPGFEEWDSTSNRGEVTMVVGDRFIVKGTGRDIGDIDAVRTVVESVDTGELQGLE